MNIFSFWRSGRCVRWFVEPPSQAAREKQNTSLQCTSPNNSRLIWPFTSFLNSPINTLMALMTPFVSFHLSLARWICVTFFFFHVFFFFVMSITQKRTVIMGKRYPTNKTKQKKKLCWRCVVGNNIQNIIILNKIIWSFWFAIIFKLK